MHIDLPTRNDIERLAAARAPLSITVYLPTSPVPADTEHNVLRARALFDTAMERIREQTDSRTATAVEERLYDLLDDTEFWQDLDRSLAIFLNPTSMVEFRLPNELDEHVSVMDRFAITPLLRATTFPQAAHVLAISQNACRLVEVAADAPAKEVNVPGAPSDAAGFEGLRTPDSRSPHGRLRGDEGRKVRLTQYARAVDHALRPVLNAGALPLILAATEPLLSIYQGISGYAHMSQSAVRGNPEELTDAQLADSAREILDGLYAGELAELKATFLERRTNGRASTDLSDLARAAASGAIATLIVDMDAQVPGSVGDDGALILDSGSGHDAIEEIVRLAISTGARVLAVRGADMPEQVNAAGIYRYAL